VLLTGGLVLLGGRASDLLPGLVLGVSTGLVFPAGSVTAMRDVAAGRAGLASGLVTAHEVGAAPGVAVISAAAAAADQTTAAGGYRHGLAVAATIAAALAVVALLAVPPVRPAPSVTAVVP
jgi:hypothetical protein